jgi:hypothetical protein
VCLPVARNASGRLNQQPHHTKNADFQPTGKIPNTGLYNSAFFRGSLKGKTMKYKSLGLTVLLAALAGSALAQNHISSTFNCAKVDTSQPVEVGDHPGHELLTNKLTSCAFNTPFELAGLKATAMSSAVAVDARGTKFRDQGYATMTMDNGDKAYMRLQGTGTSNEKGPPNEDGTWSFTSGTGKLEGLKGKGTYKISPEAGHIEIEGDYTLPGAGTTGK